MLNRRRYTGKRRRWRWAFWVQDLAAWHNMYRAATLPQSEMDRYNKGRRRAARNRSHRRDR